MKLRRFWFEFDGSVAPPLRRGCGVTAFDYEDALALLRELVFEGDEIPPVKSVIPDFDVSAIDDKHIWPNMGLAVARGIWWPNIGLGRRYWNG
ncbi:MAG: hypothetical protein RJB62_145 [Pseudomonadota bacterium]|jgi:hypothetical protein